MLLSRESGHFGFIGQWSTLIGKNKARPPTLYPVRLIQYIHGSVFACSRSVIIFLPLAMCETTSDWEIKWEIEHGQNIRSDTWWKWHYKCILHCYLNMWLFKIIVFYCWWSTPLIDFLHYHYFKVLRSRCLNLLLCWSLVSILYWLSTLMHPVKHPSQ